MRQERRAISRTLAILLIGALLLGAAVTIGVYVSGAFRSPTNAARVAVTNASLDSADFKSTFTGKSFTCGGPVGSFITLTNTGNSEVSVTEVTIAWAGAVNAYSVSGACVIGTVGSSTSTQNLLFFNQAITADAISGSTYAGTVILSTGVQLAFVGVFL